MRDDPMVEMISVGIESRHDDTVDPARVIAGALQNDALELLVGDCGVPNVDRDQHPYTIATQPNAGRLKLPSRMSNGGLYRAGQVPVVRALLGFVGEEVGA